MTIKLKLVRNFAVVVSLMILAGGVGYRLGQNEIKTSWNNYKPTITLSNKEAPKEIDVDFALFWNVWEKVSRLYVDKTKLDPQKMAYGAMTGMVAAIGDPYTVFLPPTQNKESKESLNGSFEGIGAELGVKDKRIVVVTPLSGNPAKAAGVRAGDWILKVDGKDTANWSLPETVAKIRGQKGTSVTLDILHEGDNKPVQITITRDTIVIKSVDWKELKDRIVYLQLSRFGEGTNGEWDRTVGEVREVRGVRGLILDLRNNPGGYLSGAVYVASEFLKQGQLVVKQVNGDGTSQEYKVTRLGKLLDIPVVVLVNKGSASAAEIVGGALSALGRVKIVGTQSFGKGSVQEAQDLPGGAGLHVTISKWLLPNDKWINGEGLTPDVKIENNESSPSADLQLDKAIEVLNLDIKTSR